MNNTKILEIHYLSICNLPCNAYFVTSEEEIKVIEEQLQIIRDPVGFVTFVVDGQSFLIRLDLINNINFKWAKDNFTEAR